MHQTTTMTSGFLSVFICSSIESSTRAFKQHFSVIYNYERYEQVMCCVASLIHTIKWFFLVCAEKKIMTLVGDDGQCKWFILILETQEITVHSFQSLCSYFVHISLLWLMLKNEGSVPNILEVHYLKIKFLKKGKFSSEKLSTSVANRLEKAAHALWPLSTLIHCLCRKK